MVTAAFPRIQELNSYTTVVSELRPVKELDDDFIRGFSVVIMHDCAEVTMLI